MYAPLPPKMPKYKFEPMSLADVAHWVESYNRWVELWNKHERSRDLPLSPEWSEGISIMQTRVRSALLFRVRATERHGWIRFRGFRHFEEGWSFCRVPACAESMIWAGWEIGR